LRDVRTDTIARTIRLPYAYKAEFAWLAESKQLRVRWLPDVSRINSARHRRKFFEAYAAARREFMRDVATAVGGNVAILDVPGEVTDGKFALEHVNPATKH
jgi:hypothetical protein